MTDHDMYFDRRVPQALLDALRSGPAIQLVDLATADTPRFDLQLRSDRKKPYESKATLYAGDTAVLDLGHHSGSSRQPPHFVLGVHDKHAAAGPDVPWDQKLSPEELGNAWPTVRDYLTAVDDTELVTKALKKEGGVHVGISSRTSDAYRVIQREAVPGFKNRDVKAMYKERWRTAFATAADESDTGEDWWPRSTKWSVGTKLDFLAVDIGGRLLAMEAKHSDATAGEIAKVAIQTGTYAAMFADLLAENDDAVEVIEEMLEQRTQLGLTRSGTMHLRNEGIVVPVIAIGPGRPSEEVHRRMWTIAKVVDNARAAGRSVDPIEVWYLDQAGRIQSIERAEDVDL